jgi:hypothetical protein
MMGLERLMRKLYGTTPYINLDEWKVRTRISSPVRFDFPDLADQVKRTNVTTLKVRLEVEAEFGEGKMIFHPTGQAFPLDGAPPADPKRGWRRLEVLEWGSANPRVKLELP